MMRFEPPHKATAPRRTVLLLCLVVAGCGGERPATDRTPPAQAPPPLPAPGRAPAASRPDSIADTLSIEGMPQPMVFRLFRSPAGFPLPFSTYLPADMAAVAARSAEGEALRFEARFGGTPNPAIYLEVVALPEGTSPAAAREAARREAGRLGEVAEATEPRDPWATDRFAFHESGGVIGDVSLGRHGGRYFYLVTHLPAEAADGFGPRARRVLDDWRWSDTGRPLGAD